LCPTNFVISVTIIDARANMVKWGIFITAAMFADLITFTLFVPLVGIQAELNPIMALGYSIYGLGVVFLLKLVVTITIILLVARVERVHFKTFAACLGIAFGLLGTLGNVTAAIVSGRL
jgi:hypothetical protein